MANPQSQAGHARTGTRLAVPITHGEKPLAEQFDAAVSAGAGIVELRVDRIGDVDAVERFLAERTRHKTPDGVDLIVTVRSPEEGGQWRATEAERIAVIRRLAKHTGCLVDIEHATWARTAELREAVKAQSLILSHHDLTGTPAGLNAVFSRLARTPEAVIKAVFTARDATDALRVLSELRDRSGARRVIALAMGEAGILSRILAAKFNAFLTFAALERGDESAPGQPTISELLELYRWNRIGPGTRVFGVIGWPVTHSLSPHIHNAAMAADGTDGVYLPIPVRPAFADFATFMDYVADNPWLDIRGLSVTLPHKQHALRWLDQRNQSISELARRCGATNTLVRNDNGSWRGENSDGLGAVRALQTIAEFDHDGLNGRAADVLGAGGAARGVVAALLDRGCRVTVYNRTEERARELARDLRCAWKPWQQRNACAGEILINCTSIGMTPHVDASPMERTDSGPIRVVLDAVYAPVETRLLRDARARGSRVITGREMFLGQAAVQYELWHGRAAPLSVMRAAFDAADH